MLIKQEILLGKGTWVESNRVKGTQENCSAPVLAVLGFIVMGLVSGLFLASHSDSRYSWWHTHCSAKMEGIEKGSGK